MKVKDIVSKLTIDSNLEIFIENEKHCILTQLTQQEIQDNEPNYVMGMTVKKLEVINNIMTLYVI